MCDVFDKVEYIQKKKREKRQVDILQKGELETKVKVNKVTEEGNV